MIKAVATALAVPVLVMAVSPEEAEQLTAGQVVTTNIRSRSGIEAVVMLMIGSDAEIRATLDRFPGDFTITHEGPIVGRTIEEALS